jgi:hypothetical protein
MTLSKTYKSKIAAQFSILISRIKNKLNGRKLAVETYSIKYNTTTQEYTVVMNFMTQSESTNLLSIIDATKELLNNIETLQPHIANSTPTAPKIQDEDADTEYIAKAQKWAADVEKNRQKQLAEKKVKVAKTPVAVESTKAKKPTKDKSVPAIKARESKNKL